LDNLGAVFTDTSTTDLNSSTLGFEFDVLVFEDKVQLLSKVIEGTWSIVLDVRVLKCK
jgi:hypothetical protein